MRALLRQEAVDAGGRPRCDATAEEVRVLSPDRTPESIRKTSRCGMTFSTKRDAPLAT
jgi:hypothetical protein